MASLIKEIHGQYRVAYLSSLLISLWVEEARAHGLCRTLTPSALTGVLESRGFLVLAVFHRSRRSWWMSKVDRCLTSHFAVRLGPVNTLEIRL
jgi:hypothetical protein